MASAGVREAAPLRPAVEGRVAVWGDGKKREMGKLFPCFITSLNFTFNKIIIKQKRHAHFFALGDIQKHVPSNYFVLGKPRMFYSSECG